MIHGHVEDHPKKSRKSKQKYKRKKAKYIKSKSCEKEGT
jgi:hypothetical protein